MRSSHPFHAEVARVALAAAARYGFAAGGGFALIDVYALIDRPTEDVDLFTDQDGGVREAVSYVRSALEAAGFEVVQVDDTAELADLFDGFELDMAEFEVRRDGQAVRLSLARLDRGHRPVVMDIGPVLDIADVLASKVAALASRAEPRDYADVAAALGRYDQDELIALARRLDPGLSDGDFAAVGRRLDALPDDILVGQYGMSHESVAEIRTRMANWPRDASGGDDRE